MFVVVMSKLGLRFSLIARFSWADAYAPPNKDSLPDTLNVVLGMISRRLTIQMGI